MFHGVLSCVVKACIYAGFRSRTCYFMLRKVALVLSKICVNLCAGAACRKPYLPGTARKRNGNGTFTLRIRYRHNTDTLQKCIV